MEMGRLLLVHFLLLPAVAGTAHNRNLVERQVDVVLSPDLTSYSLPDSFILLGSETVEIAGHSVDTSQYRIDYDSGLIQLRESAAGTMEVCYQVFPFPLNLQYHHREEVTDSTAPPPIQDPRDGQTGETVGDGLRIGGSKTFSIGIGSKDELSVNQSLQLRLGGQVSGVAVSGVLSDKNTGLDESSTRSVEEMDDVYMEVESERFKCRIGAYDLKNDENRFCKFERKLEGVMGRVSFAGIDAEAAGASTRRRFRTHTFRGEDGKQGPYHLGGSNGDNSFRVVGGSERVYLDGQRLERGGDADYLIDYESGTVEFTPRRLITSESRITVDFQHSDEHFKKKVYSARIAAGLPAKNLNFTASFFTERDRLESSPENPLQEGMTQRLAAAETDSEEVWVDGGELVADGTGDYLKNGDHYEYVGDNLGNYRVNFTYVGDSKGDYLYEEERGGYHWVQHGAGDHLAQIRVALPQNRALCDMKVTYEPIEDLNVEYEHAWATRDPNTMSTSDRVRNSDAHFVQLRLEEKHLGWGKLAFSTRVWKTAKEFELPSQVVSEEKQRWDERLDLRGCEAQEVEATYCVPALRIGISTGRMRSRDASLFRREVNTTLNPGGSSRAFLSYGSVARREGDGAHVKSRTTVGVSHQFWHLAPSLVYSREIDNSEKVGTYGLIVDLIRVACLSGSYEAQLITRDQRESRQLWESESSERRDILRFQLNSSHTRADCSYTRRRKHSLKSAAGRLDYSLVAFSLSSAPIEDRMELHLSSSFTSRKSQRREVVYVEVDEGKGDYVRDPVSGEYYPCERGDYIREYRWTGDSEPGLGLAFNLHSRLRPTAAVAFTSRFLTEREVGDQDELLNIWSGQSVRNLVENAVEISSAERGITLRLDHRWSLTLNPWGQREVKDRRSVSVRAAGLKMQLIVQATEERSRSQTSSHVRMEDRERRVEATEALTLRPFSFSLLEGIERKQVRFPYHYSSLGWVGVNSFFLGPSVRFEVDTKYSVEGRAKVSFSTSGEEIPYVLAMTNPRGMVYEWAALLNYWLNQSVSSTFIYEGEKRRGDPDHQLRAEIRGYF